jgi:HEAT repeat protein
MPAGDTPDKPKAEEIDPDVLRKVRKLVQATLSTEEAEREKGWKGLRDMGNLAVPGLLALYRQKLATPEMMNSIVIALGDCRDARSGPALLEILASDHKSLRRDAARAIGESNYKAGKPALEKVAQDAQEDEDVRLYAAIAGAKLGSDECLKILEVLYGSQRPEVRSRVIFALGKYGGVARIPVVEKALGDNDSSVREDAVEALRLIDKKDAWGPLVKATADQEYKVRNAAMDALRQLTKKKIENDPKAWQDWWAKAREKKVDVKEDEPAKNREEKRDQDDEGE